MSNQWDNWRPKTTHAYCTKCGLVLGGPQKDRYWPTPDPADENSGVQAADDTRYYTLEEANAAGLEHNVSGAICSPCSQRVLEAWRATRTPPPPTDDSASGSGA